MMAGFPFGDAPFGDLPPPPAPPAPLGLDSIDTTRRAILTRLAGQELLTGRAGTYQVLVVDGFPMPL